MIIENKTALTGRAPSQSEFSQAEFNQMTKKTELVAIEAKDLQIIEYRSQRVVTTEQMAAAYGTDTNNINVNYHRNQERFIEERHYFDIQGDELREIKNRLSLSNAVGKRARSLRLWTERGAATHAKMLETDQAWSCYEEMSEFYFSHRETIAEPVDAMQLLNDPITLRNLLLNYSGDNERLKDENKQLANTVESLENLFSEGLTPVQFAKRLNGVNTSRLNAFLCESNWLYDGTSNSSSATWRPTSYARDNYLTEKSRTISYGNRNEFQSYSPILLRKGATWIHKKYIEGKLPMKKDWDGKFTHSKKLPGTFSN